MSAQRPIQVAIVGGGCAAMAAAFELTRPQHGKRYEVTVYQLGWRLGGKGASGRGPANRIEEHGLHLWMGFYENAFRLMRECYAELGRDPRTCPIADWSDAFVPAPLIGIADRTPEDWSVWQGALPPGPGLPGDPPEAGRRPGAIDYMARTVALLRTLIGSLDDAGQGEATGRAWTSRGAGGPGPEAIAERISRLLGYGELATLVALAEAVALLETVLGALNLYPQSLVLRFLDAIREGARAQLEARLAGDVRLRRVWEVIDLTLATLRGEVRFAIPSDPRGFDAIDEYDCREWLLLNGASPRSLESGFLRALYDLGFSYEDGDATRPRIAAGQALRSTLRAFFTYRGAFFWRMTAGMGDVVFAPFYEVLVRRGVRFEFFHRLEGVRLAAPAAVHAGESPHVAALEFDVQARVRDGGAYWPLVDVDGLPCWPSTPDHLQLEDGERLAVEGWDFESHWDRRRSGSRTLRVGEDFDLVVLAVGLGAIPHVCRDLVERDPRWRAMLDHVKTVPTQAFQIWLAADMKDLGWSHPPINVSGFVTPFDTWADMRHLIPRESWPAAPQSLAYFCSVLPDAPAPETLRPDYPIRQREAVLRNAVRFLNEDVVHLWPRAARAPGAFRWELLVCPEGTSFPPDESRFAAQFWTANVNPSDRYVLSLPGSSVYRISPLDDAYDNLVVAGDWTDCGFNGGCVEAAVMSGRLAAHALSLSPPLEDIVGYDHP